MGNGTVAKECNPCPFERAHRVELDSFSEDLREVKARIGRLETTLARGVMLLVANLTGVVVMLVRQLLGS
jgi:hypothetical protein